MSLSRSTSQTAGLTRTKLHDPAYWRRCRVCTMWICPDFDAAPEAQRDTCLCCAEGGHPVSCACLWSKP